MYNLVTETICYIFKKKNRISSANKYIIPLEKW